MFKRSERVLAPRNGQVVQAGIVARISGCQNQKEMSLDDQLDHGKAVASELYDGPIVFEEIATTGKGERLDRSELATIERMLESKTLDLLIVEDLGRLVRGHEAVRLCGVAVDNGTRVLAPNDGIDTWDDNWEEDALAACRDHVGHNAHTSKRLKHKLKNRFIKFGGATARPIYGYIVPPDAMTYDDWRLDDAAHPKIVEGAERLLVSLNCSAVADWLNATGVPTGPYCRLKKWTGQMVRRYFANPILKGVAERGRLHTVKNHRTGRRVSVKNPEGPVVYSVPHLAHLNADLFDQLNAKLRERNAKRSRPKINGVDPLKGVSKKRSKFPGQLARCWYCGRHFEWGANGISDHLMCVGSRKYCCWNSIGLDGPLAADRIVSAILGELDRLDGFSVQIAEMVSSAVLDLTGDRSRRLQELATEEQALSKAKCNVQAAIVEYGPTDLIREKLEELNAREKDLFFKRTRLANERGRDIVLPDSAAELRNALDTEFRRLAVDSYDFAQLMRLLVPQFFVYLVRLCDGGHLLPRAKVRLNLGAMFPDLERVTGAQSLLTRDLTVDLFEPPQREVIRVEAVRLAATGLRQRDMTALLPDNPTQAAISKAVRLNQRMLAIGLDDPCILVLEPPSDYPKLRRYKHPRYSFEALEGYERPQL
jgi:hypothetical protein